MKRSIIKYYFENLLEIEDEDYVEIDEEHVFKSLFPIKINIPKNTKLNDKLFNITNGFEFEWLESDGIKELIKGNAILHGSLKINNKNWMTSIEIENSKVYNITCIDMDTDKEIYLIDKGKTVLSAESARVGPKLQIKYTYA